LTSQKSKLDLSIAELEKKLIDLKAQRDQVCSKLANATAEWNAKKDRLNQVNCRIDELNKIIAGINAKCDAIKVGYQQM